MHLLAREETGLRCLLQVALAELDCAVPCPVPIARIAAAEGLSDVYAAKLMRQLRLAGLVESTRGAGGGYRLARDARTISVWDAIHGLDESYLPGATCDCSPAERLDCRRTTACAVTSLWRTLGRDIRASLEAVSLADLCAGALDDARTGPTDSIQLPTLHPQEPAAAPDLQEPAAALQLREQATAPHLQEPATGPSGTAAGPTAATLPTTTPPTRIR